MTQPIGQRSEEYSYVKAAVFGMINLAKRIVNWITSFFAAESKPLPAPQPPQLQPAALPLPKPLSDKERLALFPTPQEVLAMRDSLPTVQQRAVHIAVADEARKNMGWMGQTWAEWVQGTADAHRAAQGKALAERNPYLLILPLRSHLP